MVCRARNDDIALCCVCCIIPDFTVFVFWNRNFVCTALGYMIASCIYLLWCLENGISKPSAPTLTGPISFSRSSSTSILGWPPSITLVTHLVIIWFTRARSQGVACVYIHSQIGPNRCHQQRMLVIFRNVLLCYHIFLMYVLSVVVGRVLSALYSFFAE